MFSVRRAGTKDIDLIVDLRIAFLKEELKVSAEESLDTTYIRRYIEEKLPTGEFLVWLAEDEGKAVGIGAVIINHRPPKFQNDTELYAFIYNMYTLPEYRNRGVATSILQHMTEHLKKANVYYIILYASDMGRPVYERFGFKASDNYMTLSLT